MDSHQSTNGEESSGTAVVFERVTTRLEGDEAARSLWQKVQNETTSAGVGSAISYVRTRFLELSTRAKAVLPADRKR